MYQYHSQGCTTLWGIPFCFGVVPWQLTDNFATSHLHPSSNHYVPKNISDLTTSYLWFTSRHYNQTGYSVPWILQHCNQSCNVHWLIWLRLSCNRKLQVMLPSNAPCNSQFCIFQVPMIPSSYRKNSEGPQISHWFQEICCPSEFFSISR